MDEARPAVPESLQEPFRSALLAAADAWTEREGLVSIVLFGSVARGEARPASDIDVLLVAEGLPRSQAGSTAAISRRVGSRAEGAGSAAGR